MIKIDFEFQTKHGVFRDALYLPENHSFSNSEIDQMKQQRLDNWISIVEAPPVEEVINSVDTETIEISGEVYTKLNNIPPSGAKLIEVDKVWYFKE